MAFRKEDRAVLAHWLTQQKQQLRRKEKALEDGKTWFKRAQLAARQGKSDLAREAHRRAVQAREEHEKAVRQLESIRMELEALRAGEAATAPTDSGAAERAAQIEENFRGIGIDTGLAQLDALADRSDAEQALGNLRRTLNPERPAASTDPADDDATLDEAASGATPDQAASGATPDQAASGATPDQAASGATPEPDPASASDLNPKGSSLRSATAKPPADKGTSADASPAFRDSGVAPSDKDASTNTIRFERLGDDES